MKNFKINESAVSPIIGVILMVAITVILAAVIAVFVFGLSSEQQKPPTTSISVVNNVDTTEMDLKIQHKGGDILVGGGWKVSIVPVGDPPDFITANSSSFFKVANTINTENTTVNANWLSNTTLDGGGTLIRGGRYDVKIIQFPSEVLLFDEVIEVR